MCLDVNTGKVVGGNRVSLQRNEIFRKRRVGRYADDDVTVVKTRQCSGFPDPFRDPQGTPRRSCRVPCAHQCRPCVVDLRQRT